MRGAGNYGDQLVQFRMSDAERIANVVNIVEGSRRIRKGSVLPRAAGGGGGQVFTASFVGNWPQGSYRTIEISGTTADVKNPMQSVPYSSAIRLCFVTKVAGEYVLLRSECR